MAKYRKKPVIVDAEIYRKGMEDGFACDGCTNPVCSGNDMNCKDMKPYIQSLEGKMFISDGDYIITGIKGERYPIKENIFKETYERCN